MPLNEILTTPEAVGYDKAHLQHAEAILAQGVKNRIFPAATYMVLRHGMLFAQTAFGTAQPDAKPPVPANLDTVFDLASITKTFTATLLLQSIEEGKILLTNELSDFIPEAISTPLAPLTIKQLATHTSGLPPWKALYKRTKGSALEDILTTKLEKAPSTHYAYSDLGYILLGEILTRLHSKPLDALVQERICVPLGMKSSGYCPKAPLHSKIAATANCPMREGKTLLGEVHDANAHSMGGVAGHAGMFGSAPDLARYAVSLCYPEVARHLSIPPLLGNLARCLMQKSQIEPTIGGHSIGWFTPPNGYLPRGDLLSKATFGHTGFTGTLLMFDRKNDITIILLTNRVYMPGDGKESLRMRRLFANAVAGALRH